MTSDTVLPRISVVMAVHNCEPYLQAAVESILNQTSRDFEFIIIDDGSSDGSIAILEKYAACDQRIRLVSRGNLGLTKSLNEGLALAKGEYIARMDADDISLPERFARQVDFLDSNPGHVAIGANVMMTDGELRPLRLRPQPRTHREICRELLLGNGGAMTHPVIIFRRAAAEKVGGYDERFVVAQDLDLLIRLSEIGLLENLGEVLLYWRQHDESVNHKKFSTWHMVKRLAIKEAIIRQGPETYANGLFPAGEFYPTNRCAIDWGKEALGGGQLHTAWHFAFKALGDGRHRKSALKLIAKIVISKIRSKSCSL
jgi:glycosyltransferase involved in cell wall biosynthesis